MSLALKPYPEYRDSGLPWLGKIPYHWQLTPNRGLIRKRKVLVGNRHPEYKLLSLTKQRCHSSRRVSVEREILSRHGNIPTSP